MYILSHSCTFVNTYFFALFIFVNDTGTLYWGVGIVSEFGKYLRELRESRGLGVNQLAAFSNVSPSTISKIENGHRGVPKPNILKKLAKPLGVDYEVLMEKAGHINKKTLPQDYGLVPVDFDRMVKLPILGTIRAGEPIDMLENIEGYELVEPELLRGREGFVLKVKGNSMSGDYIFDGYKVVVVLQEEVSPSDIAVVAVNGNEATLKRVKCQGEMCVLSSSNPQFEPMIYPADQVHIIGKVVRFWKDV